jgi:hypothetical protein
MRHFLRLTRHASTAQHLTAVADALGCEPSNLTIHTSDIGPFGEDPQRTLDAIIRSACSRIGQGLDGVEVIGPAHILDALRKLPAARYRAIMARDANGRVMIQRDELGDPVLENGRDVQVIDRYERVTEQDGSVHWPDGGPAIRYDADDNGCCDCDGRHRSECLEFST